MTAHLPLTVMAWDGPQARAYLARMALADLRPARLLLLVSDPAAERRGRPTRLDDPALVKRALRAQDRARCFHPHEIRKKHPALVDAIRRAMADVTADPAAMYARMYDDF